MSTIHLRQDLERVLLKNFENGTSEMTNHAVAEWLYQQGLLDEEEWEENRVEEMESVTEDVESVEA